MTNLKIALLVMSFSLLTACSVDTGFLTPPTVGDGPVVIPREPGSIKGNGILPPAIEINSVAKKQIHGTNGTRADISVGTITAPIEVKSQNGYRAFLSVNGQNISP